MAASRPAEVARMRIARVIYNDRFIARVEGNEAVPLLLERESPGFDGLRQLLETGDDLTRAAGIGPPVPFDRCVLLAPVRAPQKVLGIGLNYADHARESGVEPPTAPIVFAKTPNSIVGHGNAITWSSTRSREVDYEAELAVIIGRQARNVSIKDALSYVFGYTCCNDVSARDAQFADGQWVRGKSFDSFCPLGPWIVTADEIDDPQNLRIRCRVDGQTLQDSNTGEMIFDVAELISYLSHDMTLEPGDVIATGTPFGVGFSRTPPIYLKDGSVVEVEIDGIGTLANPVRCT